MAYKGGTYYSRNRLERIQYQRKYKKKDPDKVRDSFLRCVYGVTIEAYKEMEARQDKKCAICGSEFTEKLAGNLDHCHTTNTIRGILCRYCNLGLGHFKDNIDRLVKAIDYLRTFSEGSYVEGQLGQLA